MAVVGGATRRYPNKQAVRITGMGCLQALYVMQPMLSVRAIMLYLHF